MECKTVEFSADGQVQFDFHANSKPYSVSGDFLVDAAAKGVVRATFEFSDVMGSRSDGEVTWRILKTDYENFAIVTSCYQEGMIFKEYVYMIVRDPQVSKVDKALLDIEFMNVHYPEGGQMEEQDLSGCFQITETIDEKVELHRTAGIDGEEKTLQEILRETLFPPPTVDESPVETPKPTKIPHFVVIRIMDGNVVINGNLDSDPIVLTPGEYPEIFAEGILPSVSSGGQSAASPTIMPIIPPTIQPVDSLDEINIEETLNNIQKYYQDNPSFENNLPGIITSKLKNPPKLITSENHNDEIKLEDGSTDTSQTQLITDMIKRLYVESQQLNSLRAVGSPTPNVQVAVLPRDEIVPLRELIMNSFNN